MVGPMYGYCRLYKILLNQQILFDNSEIENKKATTLIIISRLQNNLLRAETLRRFAPNYLIRPQ
jgi:hypothetical protein